VCPLRTLKRKGGARRGNAKDGQGIPADCRCAWNPAMHSLAMVHEGGIAPRPGATRAATKTKTNANADHAARKGRAVDCEGDKGVCRMSTPDLSARFPNASLTFLRINGYANIPPDSKTPAPVAQRSLCDGALAARKTQKGDTAFRLVSVTSFRSRLIDSDNLVAKWHIDALRYAGILPSDAPERALIQTRQVKCAKGKERTEIEISLVP